MRDDVTAEWSGSNRVEIDPPSWRQVGRVFASWSRPCIGLALILAIFAPWPPSARSLPAAKPTGRAFGASSLPITSFAICGENPTIATTDESGHATLWRYTDGWAPSHTVEFAGRAAGVAFSADGHYLAISGDEPYVDVWDLARANGKQPLRLSAHWPSDLKLSPDGQTLAISSHATPDVVVWDIAAGRERLTLKGHSAPVKHLAFAPDGRSLASATGSIADARIILWSLATGQPARHITPGSAPQAIAYSPDSRLVASACPHEKQVRIWDAGSAAPVRVITGHSQSTRSVAFSPDGKLLATGAGDGSACLWSVATGRELRRLDSEADVIHNVAFSSDGKSLVATANDGDIRLWDVSGLIGNGIAD
jgi:WD40 repeat protein